jgi:hypothetical protein
MFLMDGKNRTMKKISGHNRGNNRILVKTA